MPVSAASSPVAAWKNHCVENPEAVIVDWSSLLFALLVDSLLIWGPAVLALFLAPAHQGSFALVIVLLALMANCSLYARGTTLGTYIGGFRLRTRRHQAPGLAYGLVLTLLSFAPILAIGFLFAVSFTPGNNVSGSLGRPEGRAFNPEVAARRKSQPVMKSDRSTWRRPCASCSCLPAWT